MKTYTFIYMDRLGNELKRETRESPSIKEARKLAKQLWANSMINDLNVISVIKQ